jgi:ATPase subunit of ABC transporter with duplicated ATPase domains
VLVGVLWAGRRHDSPNSEQPAILRIRAVAARTNIAVTATPGPVPSRAVLRATELTIEVSDRVLVDDASFSVYPGDKVGLVGRNGAGKTTLLRALAGERPATEGRVQVTGALGFLPQDPRADRGRAKDTTMMYVLSARGIDGRRDELERFRRDMEDDPSDRAIRRFSNAEEAFRDAGGYRAEADVHRILAGLGVPADRADVPLDALSGGERRRVELARILFGGTDNLVLDEPTNHLDLDAKEWLMGFLRAYRGALLVVSHDLQLLDQAITKVLHLDDGDLREYRGTYTQYVTARAEDEDRLRRIAARQRAEIGRLSSLADRMRHSTAKRARQAKSLDRRVARITADAVTPIRAARTVRYRFPPPPHSGRDVLAVDALSKSFGPRTIWTDLAFALRRGERLLVLGLNGAGKTTLLRILAGIEPFDAGDLVFGTGVSLGYYAQEHEGITAGVRVVDHLREGTLTTETEQRSALGAFGLVGDVAFQDAGTLSGGEKTKLALAQLVAGRHNLLLLDEPTNNLDPPSRAAIGAALSTWPGSMVLVSHDTEFVDALAPNLALLLPDGTLDYWSNDLLDLVPLA